MSCIKSINTTELENLMSTDPNCVIVDVRTPEEYNVSHIADAINFPLNLLQFFDLDKNKKIVVYCLSGQRSKKAAIQLQRKGYDVYDLGSINHYTGAIV